MNRTNRKSTRELRKFGVTIGLVLAALAAILLWKGRPAALYCGVGSAVLVLSGLVAPRALRPVEFLWMRLAEALAFVSTKVILTLAFFLVIMPFGLAMRLLGRDLLELRIDRSAKSYWDREPKDGPRTRPTKPY